MKRILIAVLLLFAIIGYIKGLAKFIECDFEPSYKAEVVYGIGAFTSLNAVIGYFDFGK